MFPFMPPLIHRATQIMVKLVLKPKASAERLDPRHPCVVRDCPCVELLLNATHHQ